MLKIVVFFVCVMPKALINISELNLVKSILVRFHLTVCATYHTIYVHINTECTDIELI